MTDELKQLHTYLTTKHEYKDDLETLQNQASNSDLINWYLYICYEENYTTDAEWLIQNKIRITEAIDDDLTPLENSCDLQFVKTIKPLITKLDQETSGKIEDKKKILCSSLGITIKRLADGKVSNEDILCYKYVLEAVKNTKDLDTEQYEDGYKFTPLSYAIYYNHPDIVVDLLETVCLMNCHTSVSPIDKIDPKALGKHLDRYITTEINVGYNSF
ncbi:hypothetical protein Zmor_000393 [Zophobas morio]|uniref:Ankyrin repeat protein n=1 Tax=Zophobas morio TaxID=2755281 RepID=A0AA38MRQ2_9CUCU|nr:hypothetical protein Zmor_000393 [Zophobas morio]